MDDQNWPIDGVNVLNFGSEVPWPDWWEYSVYQPLVTVNDTAEYGSGTIQYLPVLATNYTSTNNNMMWTFNLRQNVTFSNGDTFNAYQLWGDFYSEYYLSANSSGWWQSYTIFNMNHVDFGPSTLSLMLGALLASLLLRMRWLRMRRMESTPAEISPRQRRAPWRNQ